MERVALVTGGNRGLGLETCRQLGRLGYRVVLGARDAAKGEAAAATLRDEGIAVLPWTLDVGRLDALDAIVDAITDEVGAVDVLVNNAGVVKDPHEKPSVLDARIETIRASMEINAYGPLRLCQILAPVMVVRGYGRIVNVSTGMAGLTEMDGGHPGYRMSKVALNAITRIFAAEIDEPDVKINSVCPGWVRTALGGPQATRSVEEGARGIVWAATLPPDGPSGGFFRDGEPIPW